MVKTLSSYNIPWSYNDLTSEAKIAFQTNKRRLFVRSILRRAVQQSSPPGPLGLPLYRAPHRWVSGSGSYHPHNITPEKMHLGTMAGEVTEHEDQTPVTRGHDHSLAPKEMGSENPDDFGPAVLLAEEDQQEIGGLINSDGEEVDFSDLNGLEAAQCEISQRQPEERLEDTTSSPQMNVIVKEEEEEEPLCEDAPEQPSRGEDCTMPEESEEQQQQQQQEMESSTEIRITVKEEEEEPVSFSQFGEEARTARMVSYKRLNPEDVQFSSAVLSESEPRTVQQEVSVQEPEKASLLPRMPSCSVTTSLLVIGCLLLLLCGGWLLGTMFWMHGPSDQQPHRPPPPAVSQKPQTGINNTVSDSRRQMCSLIPEAWRFDCYPERGVVVTRELCEARNCCFIPASSSASSSSAARPSGRNGIPWCFYPPDFPSYSLVSVNDTSLGQKGTLVREVKTYYPADILTLEVEIRHETDTRLRVRIIDPSNERFEVPISVPTSPRKQRVQTTFLNTTEAPLFYADQFLQFSTSLPSQFIYGLGEHRSTFLHDVHWNTFTMWARDVPPMEDTNLYGSHPFYLAMEDGGNAHGFFLLNSNAMDVVLQPAPALTWRTIGGILDFYVFLGPDPGSVIEQYVEVIGYPAMPIYWALGYHLCRWGYNTSDSTWEIVKSMRNYGIPQDVQWNDIDYMDQFMDFTIDPTKFATLPDMVKDLHAHDQRYVMILDPGISSTQPEGSYLPFDEGLKRDIFIKDAREKHLLGRTRKGFYRVWPGLTAYPDFSNEEAHEWWYDNLKRFHDKVPFDGLWIDMNEPSNFLDGSTNGCLSNNLENPPYVPAVLGGLLRSKTVCATAQQKQSVHYNLHSLYGLMEAKASARSGQDHSNTHTYTHTHTQSR
ncbi:hypothetical protein INR49_016178 [Caranx melampygus]|nr:hypothetical protein INR49_016178 [Caranx melampygus]